MVPIVDKQVRISGLNINRQTMEVAMNKLFVTLISFFVLVFFSFSSSFAGENGLKQQRCVACQKATPNTKRSVPCTKISVHFCQPKPGPVLYEVWDGERLVIRHFKKKNVCDTYTSCESAIRGATRVNLCPHDPDDPNATGRGFRTSGPPLAEFKATSKKKPLELWEKEK